ncbi:MAG: NAD(P)/FAD-dependent oxidoreductase, partial [Deltaproteobacteria bacterium]|nr:NAD(P)/FAD-dependent oxidoreductase [Deltaproteobacteria bacterium]
MEEFDVVIMGGGLAGLTTALYLRRSMPLLRVAVVEPTVRPLEEACHKVGESSVEVGAHFFDTVCGLRNYLLERHLVKNGLRYFVGDTRGPLAARREIGPSEQPVVPSYQLDRGRLENDLREMVIAQGALLLEGYSVYRLDLAPEDSERPHLVHIASKKGQSTLSARWVFDASGRRRIIQKKLNLIRPSGHTHSAAWFRIPRRLYVGELVPPSESAWHARDVDKNRWLSTCHLMGKGYWVWLIPLSSGLHSIGIVADEVHHPLESYGRPELALRWIAEHEPALYPLLAGEEMKDFLILRRYAYTSSQVFSRRGRWCCIGEAAVFVDPLYSPGSDFIGLAACLSSEFVKADLITHESLDEQLLREEVSNDFFLRFTEFATTTFRGHSHINGSPVVLPAKLYWDNFVYWSFIAPYFFNRIYAIEARAHLDFNRLLERFYLLHSRAQRVLQAWAAIEPGSANGDFVPLPQFPSLLADLHLDLLNRYAPAELLRKMEDNLSNAEVVLRELILRALKAVGPSRLSLFLERTQWTSWSDLQWSSAEQELRFRYDEEKEKRSELRRSLHRVMRDMERYLGKPEHDGDGPSMR